MRQGCWAGLLKFLHLPLTENGSRMAAPARSREVTARLRMRRRAVAASRLKRLVLRAEDRTAQARLKEQADSEIRRSHGDGDASNGAGK
ncbi:hypothetical protein GDO78_021438 [Eleutherodactylus coqui]|uniref:Uncharacterized protein n=1 Tax=Eleutherodactylus coqui TaxID=57060 RepID=A0A8J6AYM3_ELECQ|nr:hypothetical protein GDO78_021438 [Eleutherodactylus coqui]